MLAFEARNAHFDALVSTPGLKWLGQNTNHVPAHPAVIEAMVRCARDEEFHAYAPPVGLEALRAGIVADLGLAGQAALVTDGAVASLYHLCHTLLAAGDELLTTDPTWNWPMVFARSLGATVRQLPIYGPEHNYRLDPARLAEAIGPKTKLVYLVDPNNPIGTVCTGPEIAAITAAVERAGAWLIHDCTYRHFAAEHHLAARLLPARTITIYSFSKWLGLAGLRVGAMVMDPALAERLAAAAPNILGSSLLAQRAALAGLAIKDEWFPGVLALQCENQALLKQAVDCIPGLAMPVYPSHGNFVIVECYEAGIRPEALVQALAEDGIMIRQGAYHTPNFGERFVKISLSVPRDWAQALVDRLHAAVERARGLNEPVALF